MKKDLNFNLLHDKKIHLLILLLLSFSIMTINNNNERTH